MLPVVLLFLLLSVFGHFLPGWTRPDVFFGVTIDPALRQSEDARRILRVYRMILWSTSGIAISLVFVTGFLEAALVQFGGFFVALAIAHRSVLTRAVPPSAIMEVDLLAPPEKFPGGPLATFLPLASSALLAVWASRHWSQLPLQIPTHIGLHGVDRWISRTTAGVYGFIGTQAILSMIFVLSAWGVLHWSRRISGGGMHAVRDRQFRRLNVQMFLAVAYLLAAAAWIALWQPEAAGVAGAVLLLLMAIYFFRLIRVSRSVVTAPAGDRTPDACWKLGIFYFNPSDPSVFVAKRFGIGYTFNFGNRWSWALLGVIMMAIVARALLR